MRQPSVLRAAHGPRHSLGLSQASNVSPAARPSSPVLQKRSSRILFFCIRPESTASLWVVPASGGEATELVPEISPQPTLGGPASAAGIPRYQGHLELEMFYDWWPGRAK